MAIYSGFGDKVNLTAYCGKHIPSWNNNLLIVVLKGEHEDNKEEDYFWMYTLKADYGINEIESIVDKLPEIVLEGEELKKMLVQIE